ncbi:MAG: hypothetical protein QXQ81_08350 [Candidatus Thorarchaeota archaeon]
MRIVGPHRIFGDRNIQIALPGILTAPLVCYVCADCGYAELYSDQLGLKNIRNVHRIPEPAAERTPGVSYCSSCFSDVPPDAVRCPVCGAGLKSRDDR